MISKIPDRKYQKPLLLMTTKTSLISLALISTSWAALAQTTFNGNGNTGFGGTFGNGSLKLSDNGTTLFGTLTAANTFNNPFVLYIDSTPGGFSSTAGFNDGGFGDALRSAISGYNGAGQTSVLTFASGFSPDYAIAIEPGDGTDFGGLFQLANGGQNSLNYLGSVNLSPTTGGSDAPAGDYTFSLSLASIGLTPGSGEGFELFGTYISSTAYRSTEALAGDLTGTQGNNPFTQTSYANYISTVPEPSTLALAGIAGLTTLFAVRRRR
jgi:hypothetical protein